MKANTKALVLVLSSVFLATACNNAKNNSEKSQDTVEQSVTQTKNDIPYFLAERYFVNNTIKGSIPNPKIESQEEFEKMFGAATAMGPEGKPTTIDFEKQFVIAVVLPETDMETTLEPVSLQKSELEEVVFTYKKKVGKKQSHISLPAMLVVVDKSYSGNVIVNEVN